MPLLPPKKIVGINQKFLEERRVALTDFMYLLANHPIFSKDATVISFITWQNTWATYFEMLTLETNTEVLSTANLNLPEMFSDQLSKFGSNLKIVVPTYTELVKQITNYQFHLNGIHWFDTFRVCK